MTQQLKISFQQANTVRQNLRDGRFSLFVEYTPPGAEQPFKLAMKPGVDLARYVQQESRVASLAITHNDGAHACHDLVDVATHLHEHCTKESMVYLSGRGLTERETRRLLAGLASLGIGNVATCSGQAGAMHPRDKQGRALCAADGYFDAIRQIRLLRVEYPNLFIGATVNPFKYTISDVYLQLAKMVKKLNHGADFVVAQTGWDMKKYQELQWYLQSRGLAEPIVARLMLVKPDDIGLILDNRRGGMVMSREFGALLQREAQLSAVQALTAQLRRIALQAAGCRLLGYSGVQLAGFNDAATARTVVDRVSEALEEFTDYDRWLEAWNDFHNRVEMAPYPYKYYAFRNLLEAGKPTFDPAHAAHTSFSIPPPPVTDRWRYRLGKVLGLERRHGAFARLGKRLICQATGSKNWAVGKTFYLAAARCPKGLEEGACGGTWPDGTCELTERPCFYHRVLALADWRNDLEALEKAHDDR